MVFAGWKRYRILIRFIPAAICRMCCAVRWKAHLAGSAGTKPRLERTLNMHGLAPQWVAGLLAGGAMAQVEGKTIPLSDVFQNAAKQEIEAIDVPVVGMYWGVAQVARTPVDEPIVFAIAAVRIGAGCGCAGPKLP